MIVLMGVIAILPFLCDQEKATLSPEIRTQVAGSFIELSNGMVHYELAGPDTAQVVVLVHGFSVPYYIWDPTFQALRENGFRVLRYDLYGRGYSDRPMASYDRAFFEQQLFELLTALKIRRPVDLVGVSMGGAIVICFTASHPDLVRRLVLIDPVHEAMKVFPMEVPILGEYIVNVFLAPSLPENQKDDFYHPENFPDWADRYRTQMKYKGFRQAILSTLRNYLRKDIWPTYEEVGKLNKPVLLIWGREDRTLPFVGNERIQQVMEVEFLAVEEAGHIPQFEQPEVVNPELIDFLLSR